MVIKPAPIITIPNWPAVSVALNGRGKFAYYQVCRRGGLIVSRERHWT